MDCFCCLSQEKRIAIRMNELIEIQLKRDKLVARQELKLLILGAGESGKSTFMKQMKIIHGSGYGEEDRISFIPAIHQNILASAQSLIQAMQRLRISYASEQNHSYALLIASIDAGGRSLLSVDCLKMIRNLWQDAGVQGCFQRRSEFRLMDSAAYFLHALPRITCLEAEYIPSEQDILRARQPTTGINEYVFELADSPVMFRFVDVGGQRSERRKWIHCLDCVTSVIFLASLSEYDQLLQEEPSESRMDESLALFSHIISYEGFRQASFILFLNKRDILQEKILTSLFTDFYPAYDGPPRNQYTIREFLLQLYMARVPPMLDKTVYSHFTTATDTDNIRFVFAAVRDTILKINIQEYILA